jgi:NAD+ diphosphatase
MGFVPSVLPPATKEDPAWWFVFNGDRLLIRPIGHAAAVPCVPDLASLNLEPSDKLFLGSLDGLPCFCAECAPGVSAPEGMVFHRLRRLFGHLDEELFWLAGYANQIMDWDQTHRFCGRCGAPTEDKTDERAKICNKCGLVNYPRISPAIIVAVTRDHSILLARAHRFAVHMYSVIAGFVEPGETLEDCVRREVLEEVGIVVENIRYFGSQPWPFPNSLMVAFTADYGRGEIRIDENEIVDAGWFTAHNLPRIPDKVSIARQLIDWFVEKYK